MGLPEVGLERVVTKTVDLALQSQSEHTRPTEQRKAGPVKGMLGAPKNHQGYDRPQQHQQKQPQAARPPLEGRKGVLCEDHHGQGQQHDANNGSRQPFAQISVIPSHGGRKLGLIQAAISGLSRQTQHHAEQGVDQHHGQDRVQKCQPVDGLQHG